MLFDRMGQEAYKLVVGDSSPNPMPVAEPAGRQAAPPTTAEAAQANASAEPRKAGAVEPKTSDTARQSASGATRT